jgi:anti-sigma B factor antagonist
MKFTVEDEDNACIEIGSDLIHDALRALEKSLDKAAQRENTNVWLDMSDVQYICSSGFGILIGAHLRLKARNRKLRFKNVSEELRQLFYSVNLDKEFYLE